jgi:hypothetical protein
MTIFKGIQHGRAAYPLYLAESFKPQEPTALGLLAQLGIGNRKAKKDSDGTKKDPEIDAIQAQTVDWWDMKESTDALERQNEMMGKTAFANYQSDPAKFQKSKEGEAYFKTLVEIERRKSILNKNIPVGKSNLEKLTSARKSLQDKNSAGLFALSPNYNTYRIDEKTNTLIENAPGDVNGAITKDAYNNWIDKTQGSDPKTGLFKQIEPVSGTDQNAFNTKMNKHIEQAKDTEGGKWESGPKTSGVPGMFMTNTGEHISNLRKLGAVTWNTFSSDLSAEELDAAHQMYYNAIKNDNPYIYETENYKDEKGKDAIRYKLNENKERIKMSFDDYMADVVTRGKMGLHIDYNNYTNDLKNIPGWLDWNKKKIEEQSGIYYALGTGNEYFQAAAQPIDVNIGQTMTKTLRNFGTNDKLKNSKIFQGLPEEYKLDILGFNDYLSKNPNGSLQGYLSTIPDNNRRNAVADKINKLEKIQIMNEAKTAPPEPMTWAQVFGVDVDPSKGPWGNLWGVQTKGAVKEKQVSYNNNLLKLLLPGDISYNTMVGGLAFSLSKDIQDGSSYNSGKPIEANEVLYGFDQTPFTLGTVDHQKPVIISSSQVIWIPKYDQQGNPLERQPDDKGLVVTYVMVDKSRLKEMHAKIDVMENGKMVSKDVTYDSEEMKGIMKQYAMESTVGEMSKTYDNGGNEVINYGKFKDAGYQDKDQKVVVVPLMMSTRSYLIDAMNKKGRKDIVPNTAPVEDDVVSTDDNE